MQQTCQFRIDCDTSLLTNYSSEGAEPFPPYYAVVYPHPQNGHPPDGEWSNEGCLYLCVSYISQEEANLCALRQAVLCSNPPGEEIWYSAPATCTAPCPDGTVFYYTVPAGMFIAKSYADALAQAQEYACSQAVLQRFCLGALDRCTCTGGAYSSTLTVTDVHSDLTWTVVGALPPGLTLYGSVNSATISGTSLLKGTYSFQIIATDTNGNYAIKVFTIQVLEVTTTVLSDFTIGTPYSFQLTADGGSGNYNWRVATGTLPDGLTMSLTGLISGTPTSLAIGGTLTFEVVDITCEAISEPSIPPRIAMTAVSTTQIASVIGYNPFVGSVPPKRYKRVDFTGDAIEFIFDSATDTLRYSQYVLFSGYSQIDIHGNILSEHRKDVQGRNGLSTEPWYYRGNYSINSSADRSGFSHETQFEHIPNEFYRYSLTGDAQQTYPDSYFPAIALDSLQGITIAVYEQIATEVNFPPGSGIFETIPPAVINGTLGPWINFSQGYNYNATVSDEYTDADALSVAVSYTGNSRIASTFPRTVGYVSRFTSVTYTLNCTNLVVGSNYEATVTLASNSGAHVIKTYPFTASAVNQVIVDSIPTPAAGSSIEVRLPTIAYATP